MRVLIPVLVTVLMTAVSCTDQPETEFERPHMMPRSGQMGHRHGPIFGDVDRMKKKLDLSDAQIEEIRRINSEYRSQHADIRERMQPLLRSLRLLLHADEVDFTRVRTVLSDIAAVDVDRQMLIIRQRLEIEKVLTKYQRDKLRRRRSTL